MLNLSKFLVVDYSLDAMSVAVFDGGSCLLADKAPSQQGKGISLLKLIDQLLRRANVDKNSLKYIITTIGPGSFTAIRVSLTSVYALSQGLGIKIGGVNSLLALALAQEKTNSRIVPVVKAYQNEFYGAGFIINDYLPSEVFPPIACSAKELSEKLLPGDILCDEHKSLHEFIDYNDYKLGKLFDDINLAQTLGTYAINSNELALSFIRPAPLYLKIPFAQANFSKINKLKKQKWTCLNN
ncbi:MAG: tRNA (adenosine(37)-N6)-threonylcarbamoyltransferase complex dimerization subunit type 1 TsaB [SAR324 cluster bacterium]|nr:tRNA (adenosine(37)-N6)-threonylcarbamoyltransferase complex dimerization subunit type 1 TsaB [SAR324 cluster bacterium]